MAEKTTPPSPTSLEEWTRLPSYREAVRAALKEPHFVGAFAVLRSMNAPRATTSSDLNAIALCHQFHAGWEACLKALKSLADFDEAVADKLKKAAVLEAAGPWAAYTPDK